jgi:hypothetical protein
MNLQATAKAFSNALRRCVTFEVRKRLVSEKASEPTDSYVTVAKLKGGFFVEVWLGCFFDNVGEGFWVGFEHENEAQIRTLVGRQDFRKDVVDIDRIPKARKPNAKVQWVFAERYMKGGKPKGAPPFHGFGIYFAPGDDLDMRLGLNFVCRVLKTIPGFEDSVIADDAGIDIAALESADPTTRTQLIEARLGQGAYRASLLKSWDGKCAVLGLSQPEMLRASHIQPWSDCNDKERLDPNNGLLLSAHLDALFDEFLITFDAEGRMIVARQLSQQADLLKLLGGGLRKRPRPEQARYLAIHRVEFQRRHGAGAGPLDA